MMDETYFAGNQISQIEQILGYQFKDDMLLKQALTHRSLTQNYVSYERLEFFGDKILGFIVAQMLYQQFPDASEGELSKRLANLVNQTFLSGLVEHLGLVQFLQMADEAQGKLQHNPAILCDIAESILAAIFLDGGMDAAQEFITRHIDTNLTNYPIMRDPRTSLQDWCQQQGIALPDYQLIEQSGPPHQPIFTYQLEINGKTSLGTGNSKRNAIQQVAENYWTDFINDANDEGIK